MKKRTKRLTAIATAVTMCASSLFAFTACGDTACEHEYEWTTKVAPTCTEKGLDTGVCSKCDDTTFRETEAVATNHAYGEWQIVKPTAAQEGKATKVCTANAEHDKLEVTLPALESQGGGYTVTQVTAPTDIDEGESSYTLANAAGNIVFTQKTAATGVTTVERAVEAATLKKDKVRNGSAQYGDGVRFDTDGYPVEMEYSNVDYEFGESYMHYAHTSTLNEKTERWVEVKDGNLVGLQTEWGMITRMKPFDEDDEPEGVREECLKGYPFNLVTLGGTVYFGAEELLAGLYEWAVLNENGDFAEKLSVKNGVHAGEFSFSVYDEEDPDNDEDDLLTFISVAFTLSGEYSLKDLSVSTRVYAIKEYYYPSAWDDPVYLYDNFEKGADEYYHLTEEAEDANYSKDELVVKQFTYAELPSNPNNLDEMLVDSFKIYNVTVTEEEVTPYPDDEPDYIIIVPVYTKTTEFQTTDTLTMQVKKAAYLIIDDILPETANLIIDELKIYLREAGGDTELTYYGDKATATLNDENMLTLQSKIAGEVDFVIKTTKCERVIHANVAAADPDTINAVVYNYMESSDSYVTSMPDEVTVYAGKNLPIGVSVAYDVDRDMPYINAAATVTAVDEHENPVTLAQSTINDKSVYIFNSSTTGDYTVTVVSQADATVTHELTVHVVAAPAANEILVGKYVNATAGVEVVFGSGSVEVKNSEGTGTYSFTAPSSGNVVTLTHTGGSDLGYGMKISEYYNVILTYTDPVTSDPAELLLTPWTIATELMGTNWIYTYEYEDQRFGGTETMDFLLSFDLFTQQVTVQNTIIDPDYYPVDVYSYTLNDEGSGKYSFSFELVGDYHGHGLNLMQVDTTNCYFNWDEVAVTEIHLYIMDSEVTYDSFDATFEPDTWGM